MFTGIKIGFYTEMTLRAILFLCLMSFTSVVSLAQQSDFFEKETDIYASIRLYPNPAPEYVNVQLGVLHADKVSIALHTVIGNELAVEVETVNEHEIRLRVKELPAGYYFVTIKDEFTKFRATYKFLKR